MLIKRTGSLGLSDILSTLNGAAAVVALLGEVIFYRGPEIPMSEKAAEGMSQMFIDVQGALEAVADEGQRDNGYFMGELPANASISLVDKLDDATALVAFLGEAVAYRRQDIPLSDKATKGLVRMLGVVQETIEAVHHEVGSQRKQKEPWKAGDYPMQPVPRAEASEGQGARF